MRVLVLSHTSVIGAYQRRFDELCEEGGDELELTVLMPPRWYENYRAVEAFVPPDARRLGPTDGKPDVFERRTPGGRAWRQILSPPLTWGLSRKPWLNILHFHPRLGSLLGEIRPDLLDVMEEPYSLAAFLAALSARRRGVPFVFFTAQNIFKRYPPPFRWMERYVLDRAAGAYPVSTECLSILKAKGLNPRAAAAVVPLGVDPSLYRRSRRERGRIRTGFALEDRVVVGFCGRLVEEKGILWLLDAMERCLVRLGDEFAAACALIVVGDGPLREEVRSRLAVLEDAGLRAVAAGAVPHESMPAWYSAMDVVAVPSLTTPNWKEQFGRVLVEAAMCGCALIGGDSGNVPELTAELGGIVVPEGDVEALSLALEELVSSPARCRKAAAKAKAASAGYSWRAVAARTLSLYRRVLSASRAGAH